MDNSKTNWQLHSSAQPTELTKDLPFPRLEMRMTIHKNRRHEYEWVYGLVLFQYADKNFAKDETILTFIPISITTGSGDLNPNPDWPLPKPFRDEVNMWADMNSMNLPGYIVCEELGRLEKFEIDNHYAERFQQLIKT